jgi:predicted nucleic acid-binding protein
MTVASLVDTNVLVYRFDARFPRWQIAVSEDFQHDRLYGSVRVRNPFLA